VLALSREGQIAILELDRQPVRNALDAALTAALASALLELASDAQVRVVVLAGRGAGFCAGSDVKEMARESLERRLEIARQKAALLRAMASHPKPVVGAVHGFALGGGFMLAIACDFVVTAQEASWRLPEVELGFFPPWGIDCLVARVGVARARALVFGHETLDGRAALARGLAEYAVPEEQVRVQAMSLAKRLAELPAASVAATKRFFAERGFAGALDVLATETYRDNAQGAAAAETFERYRR
jgi:enoyl-CoA hydratase/carnithine racemase